MDKQAKLEAALDGLRTYRAELEAEIRQLVGPLQDELAAIDKAIKVLGGATQQHEAAVPNMESLFDRGPQGVVIGFLRRCPGQMFKPSVLARLILAGGYKPSTPRLWATQTRTALVRAVGKGIAIEGRDADGKMTFGLRPQGDGE